MRIAPTLLALCSLVCASGCFDWKHTMTTFHRSCDEEGDTGEPLDEGTIQAWIDGVDIQLRLHNMDTSCCFEQDTESEHDELYHRIEIRDEALAQDCECRCQRDFEFILRDPGPGTHSIDLYFESAYQGSVDVSLW